VSGVVINKVSGHIFFNCLLFKVPAAVAIELPKVE
jgi:hypothetical protein